MAKDTTASNPYKETICQPNYSSAKDILNTKESTDNKPIDENTCGPLQTDRKKSEQNAFSSSVCYANSPEIRAEFRDE